MVAIRERSVGRVSQGKLRLGVILCCSVDARKLIQLMGAVNGTTCVSIV